MSYPLYQQTMKKLSQSLRQTLKVPVEYVENVYSSKEAHGLEKDQEVIFPLSINLKKAGHIKVSSHLSKEQLRNVHSIIEWTLASLSHIFHKHNTSIYDHSHKAYPLIIQTNDEALALKKACRLYEKSKAQSFIHLRADHFQRYLCDSELNQTLIFISHLNNLSKEDQLFLSHFLRTSHPTPLIIGSVDQSLDSIQKSRILLPSLLEHFVSFWSDVTSDSLSTSP